MAKLYPPTIAGTIPAFCGTSIEVPFLMNRAVSMADFNGFSLKIKKISGTALAVINVLKKENQLEYNSVTFPLDKETISKLKTGQYYKLQMAYTNTAGPGIYSTVGVVKYTTAPQVYIQNLKSNVINNHIYSYQGVYKQVKVDGSWDTNDTAEKLYSSRFLFYNNKEEVVRDSGEILHNTSIDALPYEASDAFVISEDFPINEIYYIKYIATTVNGLVKSSPKYKITQRRQIPMALEATISAKVDQETGTVDVFLKGLLKNHVTSGQFILSRREVSGAIEDWKNLLYFSLQSEIPDRKLFTDYTVEQGIEYIYSLQQYNENNIVSDRIYSNSIVANFEDIFLYDGERQLKIRFNPKVTNFKATVQENKTNTLGSKHPFIVRSGIVNYKEFPIAGLVSYYMDNEEKFLSKQEIGIDIDDSFRLDSGKEDSKKKELNNITTNLIPYNIKAEREFKLQVLDWLNNGKPKLFRSPSEGNYIVRLMNVSLTPNDTLGRMLHTFNCQAVEIAEYTDENLRNFGFINADYGIKYQMRWVTVNLSEIDPITGQIKYFTGQVNKGNHYGENIERPAYHISVSEMMPGTYFEIGENKENCEKVYIGVTGAYEIMVDTPYNYIGIPEEIDGRKVQWDGLITYGYRSSTASVFDLITNVEIADVPCRRFIGEVTPDTLKGLEDIKTSILAIKYLQFFSRGYTPLYTDRDLFDPQQGGSYYYTDMNNSSYLNTTSMYNKTADDTTNLVNLDDLDKWQLYKIYWRRNNYDYQQAKGEGYYVDRMKNEMFAPFSGYYYDPMQGRLYYDDGKIFTLTYDGEEVDMSLTESLKMPGFEEYKDFSTGAGVITDIGYQTQTSTYNFEFTNPEIATLKADYEKELADYLSHQTAEGLVVVKAKYAGFIRLLTQVVEQYKEENNVTDIP